jgi:ATP-dependent DNA helicase RecG
MEEHLARRVYQMDMRLSKYFEAAIWTVANLLKEHPSIPFNPDIATAFFRAGLIEAWGRGTLKIVRECKEARLPAPIFTYDLSGFRIEFKKDAGKSSEKRSEKRSEKIGKDRKRSLKCSEQTVLLQLLTWQIILESLLGRLKNN